MHYQFRIVLGIGVLSIVGWLAGCGNSNPHLQATLTLKSDGTHFSGTVVRREASSITVTGSAGDTRTFLNSELSDIKYGAPDKSTDTSIVAGDATAATTATPDTQPPGAAVAPASDRIQIPEGTEFPVRTRGFLDSCCVYHGALSLGILDADVKGPGGAVLLPANSSVTMQLVDESTVDGRITMVFELASADFGGRHYVLAPAKGGLEPGARVTFTGAKEGSQEGRTRGLNVHLDDQTYMGFKAVTPIIVTLSK